MSMCPIYHLICTVLERDQRRYLLLVGEPEVVPEGREHVAVQRLGGLEVVRVLANGGNILGIQLDQVCAVGFDARRGDGLGEDGRASSDYTILAHTFEHGLWGISYCAS